MRSVARERHYISASIRRVIKMTSRCELGWRDCDGFYALRSEESEGKRKREREGEGREREEDEGVESRYLGQVCVSTSTTRFSLAWAPRWAGNRICRLANAVPGLTQG